MELDMARELLETENYTCVVRQGAVCHTSRQRGVKPLVQWLEEGLNVRGFSAADRVIGKATAYLYVLLGVREVYALVISRPAREVLEKNGISCVYGRLVENIINRKGDGICPFEAAVMDAQDPQDAYRAIRAKMEQMGIAL